MDPFRATGLPLERGVTRRAIVGLSADLPLDEPDGLPTGHIEGGQQRESHRHSTEQRPPFFVSIKGGCARETSESRGVVAVDGDIGLCA